jgi:hypothetical protein
MNGGIKVPRAPVLTRADHRMSVANIEGESLPERTRTYRGCGTPREQAWIEGATRAPAHERSEIEGESLPAVPVEGATRAPAHERSEIEGESLPAVPVEGATRAPVMEEL